MYILHIGFSSIICIPKVVNLYIRIWIYKQRTDYDGRGCDVHLVFSLASVMLIVGLGEVHGTPLCCQTNVMAIINKIGLCVAGRT